MNREKLKKQIIINFEKDEVTEGERLINVMQCIDAHIEQLYIPRVVSSLTTKKYEIDFGTHLRCGIDVTNNELNILGAMDGWGNGISKDVVVIKEL